MPTVDENSYLFQQQQMADDSVGKVARSYCGTGEDGWCNYVVHHEQLQRYPPGMLCVARACRLMLMFFITFCVIGLITGWALEGSMTVLEEIDTKAEMQVPSLAVCPQPWGSTFGKDISVKEAHIVSIPGGKEGPKVKWRTVSCPNGLKEDENYYGGIEEYTASAEEYTGIQAAQAHGSKPSGSHAKKKPSLQAKSGSTAPEPVAHPSHEAKHVAHESGNSSHKVGNTSGVAEAAAAEHKAAKRRLSLAFGGRRLSHRQEALAAAESPGAQRNLRQRSGTTGEAATTSLLQEESAPKGKADPASLIHTNLEAGALLDGCFCVNLQENVLKFRGERGNIKDLDYVTIKLGNLVNANPLNQQFAFGFYLGNMLPQQWSYGDAGQITEGDLRSEEVAEGKTEFSDGTAVSRFAFRKSGASQSPDGVTTLVFGYDKYLSYVIASFGSKYSFFAMMTLIITCCAAINNFGLFEIVFPERNEDGPPELEPNVAVRSIFAYICYCCIPKEDADKKEDEAKEDDA